MDLSACIQYSVGMLQSKGVDLHDLNQPVVSEIVGIHRLLIERASFFADLPRSYAVLGELSSAVPR